MSTLTQQYPTESGAQELWRHLVDVCQKVKAVEVSDIEFGSGWELSGPFTKYVREVWPGTRTNRGGGKTATSFLRQYLRETGNVVVRKDGQLFVRKTWQSMETVILWRERNRDQARKEAKVTPHEAGEDREPAPVTVSMEEPVKTEGFYHYYASGRIACWRCGKTMKGARSTGGHAKVHYKEDLANRVTELEQTVQVEGEPTSFAAAMNQMSRALNTARSEHLAIVDQLMLAEAEVARLKAELDARPEGGDDSARVALIRDVLAKYQQGGMSQFRLISDIHDVVMPDERDTE